MGFFSNVFNGIGDFFSDVGEYLYDNIPLVQKATDYITDAFDDPTKSGGLADILSGGAYTANETNRQIAAENIAFQERENQIIREREDNAVQRGAADMKAAGLSQTLAAGSPASTTATTAPHNDYQMQKIDKLGAILNLAKLKQDLKTSNALASKYNAEAEGQNLSNGVFAEGFKNEQDVKKAQVGVYLADASYQKSLTNLNNIKGETYGSYLMAELDNLKTNTKLTNEEIAYKVAQKEHLSNEDKKILQDVLESQSRVANNAHDLKIAERLGLPVGSLPSGLLGGSFSTGIALKGLFSNNSLGFKLPDNISSSTSGGGYVW